MNASPIPRILINHSSPVTKPARYYIHSSDYKVGLGAVGRTGKSGIWESHTQSTGEIQWSGSKRLLGWWWLKGIPESGSTPPPDGRMDGWMDGGMKSKGGQSLFPQVIRATSHMRLRAPDHYTSSTLIGRKGGAGPSSLHTTLEGPTECVNARRM